MSRSFAELKRQSEELDKKLVTDVKSADSYQKDVDERLWSPSKDAAGNGSAIIRFLPAHPDEDEAYVRIWSHFFKGPTGRWYVENSLTTLGQPDPCSEYNNKLWATEIEANRKQASAQKRKTNYYANIYVVNDPLKPENNGQVKIFKFGPQIFDFIKNKLVPEFEDQVRVPVFNLWDGANFRLRLRKGEYGPNYEHSEWDSPAPLFKDEKKMEEVYNQLHRLQPFKDPKNFKSYDELKTKLNQVLGLEGAGNESAREMLTETPPPAPIKETPPRQKAEETVIDDDDEDLDFFAKLSRDED